MRTDPRATRLYREVGRRIAAVRKAKTPRLTQEDLANRTAGTVSRSTIANMESGRQRISLFQLYEVASALKTSPKGLLPEPDELPPVAAEILERAEARDRSFVEEVRAATHRRSVFEPTGEADE